MNKRDQVSAVDQLISERGIETDATRGYTKIVESFVEDEKEKLIELLKESRENLFQGIRQTMTELLLDDACEDDCKALKNKAFALKNSVYYTQKRIDTIDSFIKTLERSDSNGSMPETAE